MSHHGWVSVTSQAVPAALQSPFGRLFSPARTLSYDSHAVSLLAGAHGPLEERLLRNEADEVVFKGGQPVAVTFFKQRDANGEEIVKPSLPAGFTFLGQFIDHDMTEFRVVDPDLRLVQQNPTIAVRQRVHEDGEPTATNGRSGRLDLDSVYGLLSGVDLALFDEQGKFRLVDDRDIQRPVDYRDGRLIADPRNDENVLIVQLHVLFQRLHNRLHRGPGPGASDNDRRRAIGDTRAQVVNAFHRIVLLDYLPRVAGTRNVLAVWERLKENRSFYQRMNRRIRNAVLPMLEELADRIPVHDGLPANAPEQVQAFLRGLVGMPVEFAHGVFRLGHTQLRDSYRLNDQNVFPLFQTGLSAASAPNGQDLRGNQTITDALRVQWKHFFGGNAAKGRPLDANLPSSIFRLPPPSVGEPPVSLAERNIRRGVDFGLPSGQEAARALGGVYADVPVLTPDEVLPPEVLAKFPELREIDAQLAVATPLWLYMLREAQVQAPDRPELGRMGGLIVAETILGSLASTDGFFLGDLLDGDYEGRVAAAAQAASAGTVGEIATMVQLVNFLGGDEGTPLAL